MYNTDSSNSMSTISSNSTHSSDSSFNSDSPLKTNLNGGKRAYERGGGRSGGGSSKSSSNQYVKPGEVLAKLAALPSPNLTESQQAIIINEIYEYAPKEFEPLLLQLVHVSITLANPTSQQHMRRFLLHLACKSLMIALRLSWIVDACIPAFTTSSQAMIASSYVPPPPLAPPLMPSNGQQLPLSITITPGTFPASSEPFQPTNAALPPQQSVLIPPYSVLSLSALKSRVSDLPAQIETAAVNKCITLSRRPNSGGPAGGKGAGGGISSIVKAKGAHTASSSFRSQVISKVVRATNAVTAAAASIDTLSSMPSLVIGFAPSKDVSPEVARRLVRQKEARLALFTQQRAFVTALTSISDALVQISDKSRRRMQLQQMLTELNTRVVQNNRLFFPLTPVGGNTRWVLSIAVSECTVFSSRERAPYLLVLELCEDTEDAIDDPSPDLLRRRHPQIEALELAALATVAAGGGTGAAAAAGSRTSSLLPPKSGGNSSRGAFSSAQLYDEMKARVKSPSGTARPPPTTAAVPPSSTTTQKLPRLTTAPAPKHPRPKSHADPSREIFSSPDKNDRKRSNDGPSHGKSEPVTKEAQIVKNNRGDNASNTVGMNNCEKESIDIESNVESSQRSIEFKREDNEQKDDNLEGGVREDNKERDDKEEQGEGIKKEEEAKNEGGQEEKIGEMSLDKQTPPPVASEGDPLNQIRTLSPTCSLTNGGDGKNGNSNDYKLADYDGNGQGAVAAGNDGFMNCFEEEEEADEVERSISYSYATLPKMNPRVNESPMIKKVFGETIKRRNEMIREASRYGLCPRWRLGSLIVKAGDDMKQEEFALQLISLLNKIWSDARLTLCVRTYTAMATGPRSGLIECIRDACSIDSLKKTAGVTSLHQFFTEAYKVSSEAYCIAQRNFTESMAGYSVICYLLQIKDRHNGNLMICRTGHIVHIDFGFMLMTSPGGVNFERAPFKLSQELLEVMGGVNSTAFQYFKILVYQGMMAARERASEILSLIDLMVPCCILPCLGSCPSAARRQVESRMRFDLTTNAGFALYVRELINMSIDNWRTRRYDQFQAFQNGII